MESRSETLRLPVTVGCQHEQAPPWHDLWEITMDGASLVRLSAELLALPDPLPPGLHQLRRLTEQVIAAGLEVTPRPRRWEHGVHPATLAVDEVPTSHVNEHGARVFDKTAADMLRESGQ